MFSSLLTRLSNEQVQVMGNITLETTCVEGADAKAIDINNLIMDNLSLYDIIGPTFHQLPGEVISTLYLTHKVSTS